MSAALIDLLSLLRQPDADYGTITNGQPECRSGQPLNLRLSTTLENEAVGTLENEATQTDWLGDLSRGLGVGPPVGGGWGSAASGRAGSRDRQVDGRAGAGFGSAAQIRTGTGADVVHPVRAAGAGDPGGASGYAGHGDRRTGRLDRVGHVVPRQ